MKGNRDLVEKCQIKIHYISQNVCTLPGVYMVYPLEISLDLLDPHSRLKDRKPMEVLD